MERDKGVGFDRDETVVSNRVLGMRLLLRKFALDNKAGFTLIELVITICILGLIAYSFSVMQSCLLSAVKVDCEMTAAANLAESIMEESLRAGVGVESQGWVEKSGYEWRRTVVPLRSSGGNATLVEVKVEVRRNGGNLCSLITHIAG